MQHDLIIIGAGPAGCAAALEARARNLSVVLLERRALPRHKTCGGGVPAAAAALLPEVGIEQACEARLRFMRHTFRFGSPYYWPVSADPEDASLDVLSVTRSRFDLLLAEAASGRGADLRTGNRAVALEESSEGVVVTVSHSRGDERLSARNAICADGAVGPSARWAGRTHRASAIAMEVEVPVDWRSAPAPLTRDTMHLEFGSVPNGYAWAFPKADCVNVGAGFFAPGAIAHGAAAVAQLRQVIADTCRYVGLPHDPATATFHSHPIPLWQADTPLVSRGGRVLYTGDAATLVNPLFGDGILHALRSGRMAAAGVADGATQGYAADVRRVFGGPFTGARRISGVFYRFPERCYNAGVVRPGATVMAARMLAGESLYGQAWGKVLARLRWTRG